MYHGKAASIPSFGRPPHGGRGLKYQVIILRVFGLPESPSTRRAWIEIGVRIAERCDFASPSTRRAWIEIELGLKRGNSLGSPSTRRAWIEIVNPVCLSRIRKSRPPHGGRGLKSTRQRDSLRLLMSPSPRRAWIEICLRRKGCRQGSESPSPRRAWIEIHSR